MFEQLNIDQLKALAYDELGKMEAARMNLRLLNEEIKNRSENEQKPGNSQESA